MDGGAAARIAGRTGVMTPTLFSIQDRLDEAERLSEMAKDFPPEQAEQLRRHAKWHRLVAAEEFQLVLNAGFRECHSST